MKTVAQILHEAMAADTSHFVKTGFDGDTEYTGHIRNGDKSHKLRVYFQTDPKKYPGRAHFGFRVDGEHDYQHLPPHVGMHVGAHVHGALNRFTKENPKITHIHYKPRDPRFNDVIRRSGHHIEPDTEHEGYHIIHVKR